MRCFCKKHMIMANVTCDSPYKDDSNVKFPCGCVLTKLEALKVKVRHRQEYYLEGTGEKLKKIIPFDKPYWEIIK